MRTLSTTILAAAVALAVAGPRLAHAGPVTSEQAQPPQGYRLQMLAADLVSAGLVIGGVAVGDGSETAGWGLVGTGFAVGALGAPTIHLVHGHGLRAGLSLVTRVLAPSIGALVGAGVSSCDRSKSDVCFFDALGGAFVGWSVGYATGLALDYTVISSISDGPPSRTGGSGLSMLAVPRPGGVLIGASRTF